MKEKWYALSVEETIAKLQTEQTKGLSSEEAQNRLKQYGENKLPEVKKQSFFVRFIKHFNDILIYVLFAAAIVTTVLGHYADTVVILIVTVINAAIGFIQENKAEKALSDIKKLLSLKAQVVRDGMREEVDTAQLTLGDIVLLTPGDKVPADLRLISAHNLKLEESPLTGEAISSDKKTDTLPSDTMLGDRVNMAFSGTTVSAGTAIGVVVAIGADTEIGKINRMISEVEGITTPLIRQTSQFGKSVSLVIVGVAVLVFVFARNGKNNPFGYIYGMIAYAFVVFCNLQQIKCLLSFFYIGVDKLN